MTQNFKDNERVIVTRGSKALPKDSTVTVLGFDATADTYAVRLDDGQIKTVKATALSAVPERTFSASEIEEALEYMVTQTNAGSTPGDLTGAFREALGLNA